MAPKRLADDSLTDISRTRRQDAKRLKLSPSAEEKSDSSAPPSASVSDDSALRSSPPASVHSRQSSISSVHSSPTNDEFEASISSSSEGSLEAEPENEIIMVGGPKKPAITTYNVMEGAQDLRTRLAALLPRLVEANEVLKGEKGGQSMEEVGEGDQLIEMDLGLGVLEEKNDYDDDGSTSDDSSEIVGEEAEDGDVPASSGSMRKAPDDQRTNVMSKLLGQPPCKRRSGIQDLG